LYEWKDKQIYYKDFVDALRAIGIEKGDVIFVHSDLSVFGKLITLDRDFLLNALVDVFKDCVGENGTIIMPTFTYSFCNGEIFDVVNTKSTVGVLTEFFRKQPDVSRTIQPIFSVAIWGKHRDEFLDISKDSFDKDSIFGKMHRHNAKIIIFGSPLVESGTFLHYIEETHGVPYRYLKTFKGTIRNNDVEYEDEYTYFVRYLDKNVIVDTDRLEKHLLKTGLMKEIRLGNGRIMMIESDLFFKEGCKLLDQNIYFLLKQEPK
jgi:aminoglycoside 3-N-acetyltransferase